MEAPPTSVPFHTFNQFHSTGPSSSCPLPPPLSHHRPKIFEVCEVPEETDSPPPGDLSAQSSTENITKDSSMLPHPHRTEPAELIVSSQQQQQQVGPGMNRLTVSSLESGLGSYVGPPLSVGDSNTHSWTPEPGGPEYFPHSRFSTALPYSLPNHHLMYQPFSHSYHSFPGGGGYPPGPVPLSSSSLQNCPYISPPASSHPEQHAHYHTIPSYHPPPQQDFPPTNSSTHPSSQTRPFPTFSDVPHADLLAKAFMTFLHSIGKVYTDPTFRPLLTFLDQHLGEGPGPSHTPPIPSGQGGNSEMQPKSESCEDKESNKDEIIKEIQK